MNEGHQNDSHQKELYQEFEEQQKSFYVDVYDLFARGDEERGNIAFDNWEKRFIKFLDEKFPTKSEDYVKQTITRGTYKSFGMTVVEHFNQRKGNVVRAFIDQLINDAKRGYLDDEYIKDNTEHINSSPEKSSILKIFISHSSHDIQLVELVVDLLRSALNLKAKDIRCTSLDGYRLSGGADIDTQLRSEIVHARTLVGIISNESFDSAYVLFELGARWGQGTNLVPLLAHGMDPQSLKGPITGYNALRCDSEAQLYKFIKDVAQQIGVTPEGPHAIQTKIKRIAEYKKEPDWSSF